MKKTLYFSISLGLVLASCGLPQTNTISQTGPKSINKFQNTSGFQDSSRDNVALRYQPISTLRDIVKNKPRLKKPVQISIQPLGSQKAVQLNAPIGFKIQNTSTDSPPIFQEKFVRTHQSQDEHRSFQVSDPSKRYTLHIERSDPKLTVEINLNGTEWEDLKPWNTKEYQSSGLLLNDYNRLRIRVKGKKGEWANIIVLEGGEAGTVLKQHGHTPHNTHQAHLKNNDVNIFDPNMSDSLSHLQAAGGNDTPFGENRFLGQMTVNGSEILNIETGMLIVNFKDQQGRGAFKSTYGSESFEQFEHLDLMKLDLSKAPVQKLPGLLRQYNEINLENIAEIRFSSLKALQTMTILLDVVINHPTWVNGIELNVGMEAEQAQSPPIYDCARQPPGTRLNTPPSRYFIGSDDWEYIDPSYGKSWWMVDSKLPEAWEYSIGTGVKVAYLDTGFNTGYPNLSNGHSETKRRVIVNDYYNNIKNINESTLPGDGFIDHGHKSLMTCCAERRNNRGTAGSAPNSTIVPYFLHTGGRPFLEPVLMGSDATFSVLKSFDKVNIIGTSVTMPDLRFLTHIPLVPFYTFPSSIVGHEYVDAVKRAVDNQVIFVASAGNESSDYKERIPSNIPGVIAVGAVYPRLTIFPNDAQKDLKSNPSDPRPRVNFRQNNLDMFTCQPKSRSSENVPPHTTNEALEVADYSNFGDDLVWGPAEIKVADKFVDAPLNSINNDASFDRYGGTSSAAPFVTGIVALMKSRNPNLTQPRSKIFCVEPLSTLVSLFSVLLSFKDFPLIYLTRKLGCQGS